MNQLLIIVCIIIIYDKKWVNTFRIKFQNWSTDSGNNKCSDNWRNEDKIWATEKWIRYCTVRRYK